MIDDKPAYGEVKGTGRDGGREERGQGGKGAGRTPWSGDRRLSIALLLPVLLPPPPAIPSPATPSTSFSLAFWFYFQGHTAQKTH